MAICDALGVTAVSEQIHLRIYPDGRIEATTKGVTGKRCTAYIQVLERLLSAQTVESSYTEEYWQPQEALAACRESAPETQRLTALEKEWQ